MRAIKEAGGGGGREVRAIMDKMKRCVYTSMQERLCFIRIFEMISVKGN